MNSENVTEADNFKKLCVSRCIPFYCVAKPKLQRVCGRFSNLFISATRCNHVYSL